MDVRIDVDAGQSEAADVVGSTRQIDIVIFELGAPVAAHGELDTCARGPAGLDLSGRCNTFPAASLRLTWVCPQAKPPVTYGIHVPNAYPIRPRTVPT